MSRLRLYFRRLRKRLSTWWALRRLGLRVGAEAHLVLDPGARPLDRPVWHRIGGGAFPFGRALVACTVRGFVGQSVDIECMGRRLRVAPCRLELPLPEPTRGHVWWRLANGCEEEGGR